MTLFVLMVVNNWFIIMVSICTKPHCFGLPHTHAPPMYIYTYTCTFNRKVLLPPLTTAGLCDFTSCHFTLSQWSVTSVFIKKIQKCRGIGINGHANHQKVTKQVTIYKISYTCVNPPNVIMTLIFPQIVWTSPLTVIM